MSQKTENARELARQAHGDQMYGGEPYIKHLDDVVAILREYGVNDEDTIAAGYLHDTLEDTPLGFGEMARLFGLQVAGMVELVTDVHGPNRKTRKQFTLAKIKRHVRDHLGGERGYGDWVKGAALVKLADRIANVRASRATNQRLWLMYRKEQSSFREALFVEGWADTMWAELDRLFLRRVDNSWGKG